MFNDSRKHTLKIPQKEEHKAREGFLFSLKSHNHMCNFKSREISDCNQYVSLCNSAT